MQSAPVCVEDKQHSGEDANTEAAVHREDSGGGTGEEASEEGRRGKTDGRKGECESARVSERQSARLCRGGAGIGLR